MEEEKIQRSTRTRAPRKPKKNQIPIAIVVTILVVVAGVYLGLGSEKLPVYWIIGLCFGFILQRARFCFTASVRDPSLTGSTSLTRAVLIAFAVTTIGFTAIKYGAYINGQEIPGMSSVSPISLPLALGAVFFGIGMVIAGGCASGTLMCVGEGFTMQMLALVFFVVGSFWGAHDMGFWDGVFNTNAPKSFLPDVFGWCGALVDQGLIILLLYIAARQWQIKKMGTAD